MPASAPSPSSPRSCLDLEDEAHTVQPLKPPLRAKISAQHQHFSQHCTLLLVLVSLGELTSRPTANELLWLEGRDTYHPTNSTRFTSRRRHSYPRFSHYFTVPSFCVHGARQVNARPSLARHEAFKGVTLTAPARPSKYCPRPHRSNCPCLRLVHRAVR